MEPFPDKRQTFPISGLKKFLAGLCKHIQICAREHGIKPVLMFSQSTKNGFPVYKLALDDAESMDESSSEA